MNEWIRLVVTHSSYLLFLGKNSYFKILQGTERNLVKFLIFSCGNSQLLQ